MHLVERYYHVTFKFQSETTLNTEGRLARNRRNISNHPYTMLLTGGSGLGKNALVNLTKEQELIILLTRFICMLKT